MGTVLDTLVVRLAADLAPLNAAMSKAERNVAKFGQKMQDLGQKLSIGITLPVAALGGASVAAATKMDSLTRGLTAVTGSSAEAGRQLKRLEEVAKLPGLGFAEAVEGATRLQAAGLSAELAEKALKGFGNALASVGGGRADLDGVILALSQIQAAGKVTAEEINQIAGRLPQIRPLMEAAFGTSNTEAIQKLGISSEAFIEGLVAQLQTLPQVTGGVQNSFETLADETFRASAKMGEALLPVTLAITKVLTDLASMFRELSPGMQKAVLAFAALAAAAGPLLSIIGLTMKAVAGFNATMTVLAAASGPVLLGVVAFGALAAAGIALVKNWSIITYEVQKMVDAIREQLVGRFAAIVDAVGKKVEVVKDFFKDMYEKVVGSSYVPDMIDGIAEQFERLDAVMVKPAEAAARAVNSAFSGAGKWLQGTGLLGNVPEGTQQSTTQKLAGQAQFGGAGGEILDIAKAAAAFGPFAALMPAVNSALQTLEPMLQKLLEPLKTLGEVVGNVLAPVFAVLEPPLRAVSELFRALEPILGALVKAFVALKFPIDVLTPVLRFVATIFSYLSEGIGIFVEALGKFVDKIVPDWISKAGKGLTEWGQEMQDSARRARKGMEDAGAGVGVLGDAVSKVASSLYNVPLNFNAQLERMRIGTGALGGGLGSPALAGAGGGAGGRTVNIEQFTIVQNAGEDARDLANRVIAGLEQLAAGGDPFARSIVPIPGSAPTIGSVGLNR